MKKVIYSAIYNDDCYPFHTLAERNEVAIEPTDLKEQDSYLVIWGGSDIEPSFYGHEKSSRTWTSPSRDKKEWALLQEAVKKGIPIIGVCRGAQMLCAAAGGFLIQDVTGHAGVGRHEVITNDEVKFFVNSIHHQMMAGLENTKHELLAWTPVPISKHYVFKKDELFPVDEGFREPEFVYFPEVKGFAVQWHPEGMDQNTLATQFVLRHIREKAQ